MLHKPASVHMGYINTESRVPQLAGRIWPLGGFICPPMLSEQKIYTLLKKIKGTLKQHNVTPSQSHFCEIKLST